MPREDGTSAQSRAPEADRPATVIPPPVEALAIVRSLPVEVVPVRESLVLQAARIKARHVVSYTDAFVVATAQAHGAFVLTGDPEILALPRAVVPVRRLDR
jgi:predicted nucleic acid-binding protein